MLHRTRLDPVVSQPEPIDAPLALSIADAARLAGLGRSSIYAAIGSGALPARKFGRRTLISRDDLQRWLQGLPALADRCARNPADRL